MSLPIPYGRQDISEEDITAVVNVLRSDWLTQGPAIERFEKAVAEYCGSKYAVAVNSATSALHIACLAAGLRKKDVLWTSPNSFVASANCALYCGGSVDFVDIDPLTYNISMDALEAKLQKAARNKSLPRVVIPVHFAGQSCHMQRMAELAGRYHFSVIEDASHAIGGKYRNAAIGNCSFSDMAVFSFHPVKIITTGEGGMVLTNRHDLYEKLIRLRSHGITRNPGDMHGEPHGPWYYEQIDLGFNYRMTDIQATLGSSQLLRVDTFVKRRHELASNYERALQDLPLTLPWQHPDAYSAYHLYVVRLKLVLIRKSRSTVFRELRERGILVNVHYIPIHTQPFYRQMGFKPGDFPAAEAYYQEAISLPMYFALTDDNQQRVTCALRDILS